MLQANDFLETGKKNKKQTETDSRLLIGKGRKDRSIPLSLCTPG